MSNEINFTWFRDQGRDADKGIWVDENTWGCYIEDAIGVDEEGAEDYSMNYGSIDLLENGKFRSEVGTCGMYGGPLAEGFAETIEEAMEIAQEMFIDFYAPDGVIKSSRLTTLQDL